MKRNKLFTIDTLPGEYENRVFIAGNYNNIALLREIGKFVKACKHQPILVADYMVPEESDNESSLFLLENCKFAIFEMSTSGGGGELMELERTKDYKTKTLLLYQVRYKGDKAHIPKMIDSLKNVEIWQYPTLSELKKLINVWLCNKLK